METVLEGRVVYPQLTANVFAQRFLLPADVYPLRFSRNSCPLNGFLRHRGSFPGEGANGHPSSNLKGKVPVTRLSLVRLMRTNNKYDRK